MKVKATTICVAVILAAGAGFFALNERTDGNSTKKECKKSSHESPQNKEQKNIGKSSSTKKAKTIKATIKIEKKNFKAEFNTGAAAKKFTKKFPLRYTMEELNGNEKYKYVSYELPQNEKDVKKIKAGDIMLYGSDCIVIFYKTFETNYSYTRLGRITNIKGLKKAVGSGSVKVQFKKRK